MKMELLTLLVKLGILLITGFLAPAFKAWLEAHAEDARIERIKGYARQAVRAAEQMPAGGSGSSCLPMRSRNLWRPLSMS